MTRLCAVRCLSPSQSQSSQFVHTRQPNAVTQKALFAVLFARVTPLMMGYDTLLRVISNALRARHCKPDAMLSYLSLTRSERLRPQEPWELRCIVSSWSITSLWTRRAAKQFSRLYTPCSYGKPVTTHRQAMRRDVVTTLIAWTGSDDKDSSAFCNACSRKTPTPDQSMGDSYRAHVDLYA